MGKLYKLPTAKTKSEPHVEALFTSEADSPQPPAEATPQQDIAAMRLCPKFNSCSATICPMDKNWRLRDTTRGDAVCIWLREAAKNPTGVGAPEQVRLQVIEALPEILCSTGLAPLRSALNRAAKSGSKRDAANLPNFRQQA